MMLRPDARTSQTACWNLVHRLDDGAGIAEIAHQFAERLQPPQVFRRVVAGKLGQ